MITHRLDPKITAAEVTLAETTAAEVTLAGTVAAEVMAAETIAGRRPRGGRMMHRAGILHHVHRH